MLISYSRPESLSWTLTGTGAAFLTDDDRLTNGRPESGTRIQWLTGAQTTSSVLGLRGTWPQASVIRLCGLVGLTLPTGTRIVCSLKRAADAGYTYQSVETDVVQRFDGVRVAWFPFDAGLDEVVSVEFAIYNDVDGSAVIDADSTFQIGEAWIGEGEDWCIRPQYQSERKDLSKMNKSLGGQPFPVRRRAEAISQIEFTPQIYSDAYVDTGSFADMRERMLAFEPCVVVPITGEPFSNSAVTIANVNRHAEFGYCSNPGPIVGQAPRFVMSAQFTAPPALLPASEVVDSSGS